MLPPRDLIHLVFLLSLCAPLHSASAEPPAKTSAAADTPAAEPAQVAAPLPAEPATDTPVAAEPVTEEPVAKEPVAAAPVVAVQTESSDPLQSPFPLAQVSRLVHPDVADELGLGDVQRAKIQSLLAQRTEINVSSDAADKNQKLIAIDRKIRDTLNADQFKKWTTSGPTSELRFQFREQPWGEVLDWFARQEGLTLVMNQVPPGTFTYTDTRSYNASEAIDLLNSVLLTRSYTLVRREKMLTVLQLSNSIPIDLIPRVPLEELPSRGRFELVSVLFSLGNRPVDAVIQEVQPYLGSFGRAIALPKSKQLLVVETAGKMDTINVLINTVPEPRAVPKPDKPEKPPAPVFAAYALGELDPTVVLDKMKELVGSDRIAVDEKTRLLTAFVIPTQQTAIQTAVEKMRAEIEAAPANVSVAYPLRSGSEEQIREQVTAIAPRATVSVDTVAAQVMVTASPDEQSRIADAFTAMGITATKSDMKVKAFQVDPVQSTVISTALQTMIPTAQVVGNRSLGTVVVHGSDQDIALADQVIQRWRGADLESGVLLHAFELPRPGSVEWLATVTKVVPRAQVWLGTEAQQLILLGSGEEKARLEGMLPQLLTALPSPPDRVLQTYELSATELARWQEFLPILAEQLPGVQPIVRPAGEDGSSELLVWATQEHQARLAEVVAQIRKATPQTMLQWPKIYDLEKRDPSLFSELLAIRFPGVRVTADAASGQLTVWAERDTHGKISELLTQISDELPANPELVLKSYHSEDRTPTELQTLLAPVIASATAAGSRGTFTPIGAITVDTAGRRLMIMATEDAHQKIDQFVQELGKPMPVDQELILLAYSLAEAQASDVKLLIDQAIDGATVIADDRRQQLVVTATLAHHGRIKTLINEVDRPASKFASEEIRAYELNELQAATMLPTLQSLWPRMKLTVDVKSNRIVASGNADDHESFRLSIERLNMSGSGEEMRVETYSIPIGDLTTLPAVLNQIAPQAIISTDVVNRAIVVWASDDQHERVAAAIEQLTVTAEGRREIEVYQVTPAKVAITRLVLMSLFPAATIGADTANGQLTVLASKEMQGKIAEVLEKTSRADKEGSNLEPRLYDTTAQIRTAFASVLATTVPSATIVVTGAADPNQVMILASPEDHERVTALLGKLLDQTGPAPETKVQAFELDRADPTAFQTFLTERHPAAKILSGAGTNRLVIAATEQEHAGISQTIEELEKVFAQAGQRELHVYPIRKDLTQQAVTGVSTEVPRARLLPSGDPERILLVASATEHAKYAAWLEQLQEQVPEPEATTSQVYPLDFGDPTGAVRVLTTLLPKVVFAADTVGKTVAATGTAEDHETIKAFIQQYDDRQMDDAETKVFVLGDADATSLSLAVTQMAPTARVTPDRIGNRLIVTAPKAILERISAAIDSMESDPTKQRTSKSYGLDEGTTYSLSLAIQGSFPRAKIAADTLNNRLIISATDAEHVEIAKLFDSLNAGETKLTKSYVLENGRATITRSALQSSFPRSTISADSTSNHLIVAASESDHEKIAEVIQSMNADGKKVTQNYVLETGNSTAVRLALQASFPNATISSDSRSNSLIVSASEEDQQMIQAFVEQMNVGGQQTTQSYALENGNAATLRLALQATFPQATIGADSVNDTLIVSASAEEQKEIAVLVQQINDAPARSTDLHAYALANANPQTVVDALQQAFGRRSTVGVSADDESGTVFVVGLPREQEIAKQVIQQMDRVDPLTRDRRLKAFSLAGIDGDDVADAVESLFADARPTVDVRYDFYNEQLVVIGTEEQLNLVEETLQQFDPPERELAIFPLRENDPNSARDAVNSLFADLPTNEVPAITVDQDRQQLLIRATTQQLGEIRTLLGRLGESVQADSSTGQGSAGISGSGSRVRTVSVGRDSDSLLEQLRRVWPNLRQNPLQVIRSTDPDTEQAAPEPGDTDAGDGAKSIPTQNSASADLRGIARPNESVAESAVELVTTEVTGGQIEAAKPGTHDSPAVLILPGDGQWVIASEDAEAVDMLAKLLEVAVNPPMTAVAESGNLSIYVLKHGNAEDLEDLLTDLFQESRASARSRLTSDMSQTRIVADTRINALIVQSSRATRGVIEDLLAVLDSREFIDSLQLATPQIIPIVNTDVQRVESMLRTVYSSQLSRGRNRPQISIPEGVSAEVASMLEQINAETSGPLLTLSADDISNSIVMRAPPELSEEIRDFVKQVDQQAVSNRSGRMRIIPLQTINAEQMEQVLRQFTRSSRSGRGR
ncbi:Bacterial type II/III secretion system short domain protein [Rubripirellula lacrimiformis]|uniref:Bacterial type II/III secretion system short domain protein n=1 Tax=Rubripirellula lacrimiformis TaxID=1930273 RepID=A0A517NEG3_9BACT|nr:secretin N-terminal domain-containing protein [Rubripirellula lacrimiformis]QDT05529.1 Bacterial type II/III secretion system short domain protein [Rubripirellula lacrimiformis]